MTMKTVPIRDLKPAKDNPRRDVGDITELAASIASLGILEPLVVVSNGKGYDVVAGNRRLAAAKQARLREVPVVVRKLDDAERAEAMLIENLQRTDLAPIEEATGFQRLVELGRSQREIAARIGRNQSHVSKRLKLLELPPAAAKAVDAGRITVEDGLALVKLADEPKRLNQAFRQGQQFRGGVENAVRQQLEDAEHARLLEEARARAEADPAPFVGPARGRYGGELEIPAGSRRLSKEHGGLPITPAKHRKEPCHAITVVATHWSKPAAVYICTKPGSHAEGKTSAPAPSAAERRQREREKELRAATEGRRAFVVELLQGASPLPRDEIQTWIVDELISASWASILKLACELLDVEPIVRKGQYGSTTDVETPLRDLTKTKASKVGLALVFAAQEERLRAGWGESWKRAAPYLEALTSRGYELSAAETRALEGKS